MQLNVRVCTTRCGGAYPICPIKLWRFVMSRWMNSTDIHTVRPWSRLALVLVVMLVLASPLGARAEGPAYLVKEIRPGPEWAANLLTDVNGTLFFVADDGVHGYELWKSDGTAAGTVMVKDIQPGPGPSVPVYLTNVNGTVFFAADDGAHGHELWRSDGTADGTVLVKDIQPGTVGSQPSQLTNVNGT